MHVTQSVCRRHHHKHVQTTWLLHVSAPSSFATSDPSIDPNEPDALPYCHATSESLRRNVIHDWKSQSGQCTIIFEFLTFAASTAKHDAKQKPET